LTERQGTIAIRLLREQIAQRQQKNATIRNAFGDRITTALDQECQQRDEEIAALEAAIVAVQRTAA
jgi:predicted  nucleic acid-binding Zn-ribbon protein